MTGWLSASIAALALAGIAMAIIVPVMAKATLWASRRWPQLRDWNPLVTLSVFALAPIMIGLAIGIGAFWPGLLGHVLHLCHCETVIMSTGHSSVLHPELSVSLLPYASILLLALLIRPLRVLLSNFSAQQDIRKAIPFDREAVRVRGTSVQMLRVGNSNAFTAGLLKPTIYVDRPWWQSLNDEERHIVLTHERSHQRHRDPLALLIARVIAVHLSTARRAELLSLLVLQMETRADREAQESMGDPLTVADFLLQTHQGSTRQSPTLAFVGASLERRIEALVEASDGRCPRSIALGQWLYVAGAAGLIAVTFVFRGVFHRVAESLLSIL
jgi:Zn-dependent protease with chaperone function